ncbi:MAG TPA: mechanosensitive ion channel family protein [Gammaproteobacteria bacterium]
MDLLNHVLFGNTLLSWLGSVTVFMMVTGTLRLLLALVGRRMTRLAKLTEAQWDDIAVNVLTHTKLLFLLIVGLYVGTMLLKLTGRQQQVMDNLLVVGLIFQAGVWSTILIVSLLKSYQERVLKNDPTAVTTFNIIGIFSRLTLWSIALLLILDNIGINVTALVAGLGVGGIAVALAVQNILGDLFSSLSIMLDKPFVVGDFIIIDDYMGGVEYVGLKTTRIRSLSGEQLVFSNSDLLKSRIRNYGRMFERRVLFTLGVTYETPRVKLKRIPDIIRRSIETQNNTRFDRAHFMKYGDYALLFETVFYVLTSDYNTYMDIQQTIFFEIHEAFERENIVFAYPTQRLFVAPSGDSSFL